MKNASDWTQVIRGGPILTLQSLKWPIKLTKLWEKHAINGIAETYMHALTCKVKIDKNMI